MISKRVFITLVCLGTAPKGQGEIKRFLDSLALLSTRPDYDASVLAARDDELAVVGDGEGGHRTLVGGDLEDGRAPVQVPQADLTGPATQYDRAAVPCQAVELLPQVWK